MMAQEYMTTKVNDYKELIHNKVWEQNVGEIPKGFVVHHVNLDKFNNSLRNLICISLSEHIKLHHAIRKRFGSIPEGFVINNIDGNKENNEIDNLECIHYTEYFKKNYPKLKNLHKRREN